MSRFACPSCKQMVYLADAAVGEVRECPHCKEGVRVPGSNSGGASAGLIVGIVSLAVVVLGCPLIIIVCLAAISVLGQKASGTFTSVGTQIGPAIGPPVVLRSNNNKTEVSVPPGWAKAGLSGDNDLEVADKPNDVYLVVKSEPKSDLPGKTYRGYAQIRVDQMRKNLNDVKVLNGPNDVVINGRPAVQYVISGVTKETPLAITYLLTCADGEKDFHLVLGWSAESKFQLRRSTLDQITNSFREAQVPPLPR